MKLVFTRAEVAAAFGLSEEAFARILSLLLVEGFPRPIPGLGECWSIMEVVTWVNRDKSESLKPVATDTTGHAHVRH